MQATSMFNRTKDLLGRTLRDFKEEVDETKRKQKIAKELDSDDEKEHALPKFKLKMGGGNDIKFDKKFSADAD